VAASMRRVAIIFGTRPEAIKMAPVVHALRDRDGFEPIVVLTAQHRGLLDPMLDVFGIQAAHDLDLFRPGQTLDDILGRAVQGLGRWLEEERPDLVLVQGDTTTTLAGALSALHHHVPAGHVEAGLRTGNLMLPFPEEANRRAVTHLSTLHFAPTPACAENLAAENVPADRTFVTGNPVVDALLWCREHVEPRSDDVLGLDGDGRRVVLVTLHRRESWGAPMTSVAEAIAELATRHDDLRVVFPVHRNPVVRDSVAAPLAGLDNVQIIEPLPYPEFVHAMARSSLILSDSGGIQEEAPSLGVPVVVLRNETERPDALRAGARLAGTRREKVLEACEELLAAPPPSPENNPFGDGRAAQRIVDAIAHHLDGAPRPGDFTPRC
jgi:UDP-N-acetylglucosamine 2-epimerase (non-hydrolysing)